MNKPQALKNRHGKNVNNIVFCVPKPKIQAIVIVENTQVSDKMNK